MIPVSYIELDRKALKKNIQYLKTRIGPAKFISVIKGNAYGHGIESYLPLAEECGVEYFAVSDSSEAERAHTVKQPGSHIIIMNMVDNRDLKEIIEHGISYFVFNFDRLEKTIEVAKLIGIRAKIHIELETGFNRTGFNKKEIFKVLQICNDNNQWLEIMGVCTHYAGAESIANYYRIQNQKTAFEELKQILENNGITPKYYHTACSAAALTYPDTIMDMVRFGIAQYGFWPSNETRIYNMLSDKAHFSNDPLRRVLSWKSSVISVKDIQTGEFIGYGNNYLAINDMKVAVIPLGYYHGYSRSLSNLGYVLINKKKSPIVGMVNMNMIITDVTAVSNVKIGDEVVIIGKQGKQVITVSSFSDLSNYVNYEMLVRLPYEIPRRIVG